MTDTCSTCKFHHEISVEIEGGEATNHFCRFNPPMQIGVNQSALVVIRSDGWCGQFQVAPKKRVKA